MTTISQRIARFASGLDWDGMPEAVREKCKVSLLHNLSVALAGGPLLGAAGRYAQALEEQGPNARSRLLISGRPASADTAAFANAALMHARAQDDVYFPGLTHAGSIMVPAVLAVAEERGSTGRELVTALCAGWEAAGAISQGFAPRTTPRGFRASGIYGVFASTVGVARLLGLDAQATAHAIGIAASCASGTNQTWVAGTQEWQLQIGMASRNGILAARLAAAGATGAPDALEGSAGFYYAFMGNRDGVETVGEDLRQTWRSLDVTYKPYAVCAILQAPVKQALAFACEHDLSPDDIRAVRLHLAPAEAAYPGTDAPGPFTDIGGTLMSAQFCLSLALAERRVKGEDLRRLDDPRLRPLIARTRVIADESLVTRSFILEIDRADGSTLRHVSPVEGEPFNWDRDEVASNVRAMSDELPLSSEGIARLIEMVLAAEQVKARDLVSACIA